MTAASLIDIRNVNYSQGETEILREVTWQLHRGDHWALLGPNGSGKTTLLKIACGYLWPSEGLVLREGRELMDLREWRKRIGWISSELAAKVPPRETALETVVTGRTAQVGLRYLPNFHPSDEQFDEAREKLIAIGCEDLAGKRYGVLSQGERQQVLIARAQMAEPVLMVLDEPCAGMDPGVRERFLAWLDDWIQSGPDLTLALVTHHVEEIMPSIEQTLVMQRGSIHSAGATSDVVTPSAIESTYGVQLERLELSGDRRWPIWGC